MWSCHCCVTVCYVSVVRLCVHVTVMLLCSYHCCVTVCSCHCCVTLCSCHCCVTVRHVTVVILIIQSTFTYEQKTSMLCKIVSSWTKQPGLKIPKSKVMLINSIADKFNKNYVIMLCRFWSLNTSSIQHKKSD